MNDATLGVLIIVTSMLCGLLFCFCVCMILWIRYKNSAHPSVWSKTVLRQSKSLNYNSKSKEIPRGNLSLFPTISYSETGSEACSPISNLSTSSPLTPYGGRTFQTFLNHSGKPEGGGVSLRETSFMSSHAKKRQSPTGVGQGESWVPKLPPQTTPISRQARPSSLHFRAPSNTPSVSSAAPSSGSGTSTSPADFDTLKTPFMYPEMVVSEKGRTTISVQPEDNIKEHNTYSNKENEQMHKFKLGVVKVRVHYYAKDNILTINLLKNFQLPYHIHCRESEIYAKFTLTVGNCRHRYSKTLRPSETSQAHCEVAATFQHFVLAEELSKTSVVITLCKVVKASDQGMVIGSAFVNLKDLHLRHSEDSDTGILELPLGDSAPHQIIMCGGYLHAVLELPLESSFLCLTNIRLQGLDFSRIFSGDRQDCVKEYVQLYLKMTVYENGEAVLWRRTTPVNVSSSCEEVIMASNVFLDVTPRNLSTLQLVLSVRLKTGKRGERCVLGNIYLNELWFAKEIKLRRKNEILSPRVLLHLPLDF